MTASSSVRSLAYTAEPRLDLDGVRRDVDSMLRRFLDERFRAGPVPSTSAFARVVGGFVEGGKRLRPLFCYAGWTAAGGRPDARAVLQVGAALELFHAFALIHDDIMDASELRHGRPTMHRVFAARYHDRGSPAAARRFGTNVAILAGDLCLVWSDALLDEAQFGPAGGSGGWRAARALLDRMRTEVLTGQYLDIEIDPDADQLARALQVIRYKTAVYTVERPLQIGAALAGADESLLQACTAYGRPLGEAFQLRDDLLGAFGDPAVTGKPVLDDLREGKRTVLMILAWRRATAAQRAVIRSLHGDSSLDEPGAEQLRAVIRATGADVEVEAMINDRTGQALAALDRATMPDRTRGALVELARAATARDR